MWVALALGIAVGSACVARVSAQEEAPGAGTIPPLPPSRPSALAPSNTQAHAAPPQTPDLPVASQAPAWTPGKLLQLPRYTRPRMHECALEWQKMKASGEATDKIWFTFAQSCLIR